MKDVLEQELTGVPVTVLIRGTERPLAYPMHAAILYKQRTGDSLFVSENFKKIDLAADPERWLNCLWAGLHQFDQETKCWKAPFTFEELQALVDFSNAGEITVQMVRALAQHMPKPKALDPKAEAPGPIEVKAPEPISISTGSGLAPGSASDSAASSS